MEKIAVCLTITRSIRPKQTVDVDSNQLDELNGFKRQS